METDSAALTDRMHALLNDWTNILVADLHVRALVADWHARAAALDADYRKFMEANY